MKTITSENKDNKIIPHYTVGSQYYALIANQIVFGSIVESNAPNKFWFSGSGMTLPALSIQFVATDDQQQWLFKSLDDLYASPVWKADPTLAVNKKK